VSKIVSISGAYPAPTFGHAAEAFLIAHVAPAAWSPGTAVKYRQTLTILAARLAELDTAAGARALAEAFTAAFGALAPATLARHLSTVRSALAWWRGAGWLAGDPTAGWAERPAPSSSSRPSTEHDHEHEHYVRRGKADNTWRAYRSDLNHFGAMVAEARGASAGLHLGRTI